MRLSELEPKYLKIIDERSYKCEGVSRQEADGLFLLCPKCFSEEPYGPKGTHGIICWRPHVPQTMNPIPGRWEMVGDNFDNLSLVAGSSSILITSGCMAHFTISNGEIQWNQ